MIPLAPVFTRGPRTRTTTTRRTHAWTAALCVVLALSAPAVAQDNKDTVQLKDGKTETGRVKSEDFGGLTLEAKGGARVIEWSAIVPNGIVYTGSPEFTSGKESLDAGKFEDALTKFTELKADTKLRAPLRQNALYYIAAIHQRQGKCDEAIAGYKALAEAFPKSRYLMDIGEGLVNCLVAKKDAAGYAAASKALDDLSAAALSAGVENGFSSGINVLKGRILEEQGKIAEAKAAYGVAEKATGVSPTIVQQARLGQGRCLVLLKNKPEADVIFRKLVTEDATNAVLAGAWNGIAEILKDEAREKRDADKMLDALYAYLRGVVQYAPVPGESAGEYKRALQGSADCFKLLADLEQNADRKRMNTERQRERLEQLKKEFPNG